VRNVGFNGDGKDDIVTLNFAVEGSGRSERILERDGRLFLGNGDGIFQAAQIFDTGGYEGGFAAVGDFNRDGHLDLVVTNTVGAFLSILLGNGDGTFQAPQSYATGPNSGSVAVGDFNHDGIADLAVSNGSANTVSILLGNGDGTFGAPQSYATGSGTGLVAAADFNGDGIPDLAVTNGAVTVGGATAVSILLGNGDGTFQPPQSYVVFQPPPNLEPGPVPHSMIVADFNRDGIADLAVITDFPGSVKVLLGNGDGTFQAAQSYNVGGYQDSVAVADFNGDGFPDLAVSNYLADTVTILLNAADWGR
jgi:hypothetical protein